MNRCRCFAGLATGIAALAALSWVACSAPRPAERAGEHAEVCAELVRYVEAEMRDKRIPGMSIALVEGDEIVWARGFGLADPETGMAATAETVYRVGSVSKLFTDIAVMQLVERGEVELDAPVRTYLPEFAPQNPFGGEITLRQLMAHRGGLVREPPVGSYFDPTEPSLAETVASLERTELVYPPGTRAKYSNAGIAVVGRVLERLSGERFEDCVRRAVLEPMGLADSAFEPLPELERRAARGLMWSYDGREFAAPTFQLGMAPAGSLYSTVLDLARFLVVVLDGGRGPDGPVLRPDTLAEMLTPQFAEPGARTGFGLGFAIGELDGHALYGHGGAIYGFATQLGFLGDEELGVVVCANVDVVNSVTSRIAHQALQWMLARREGRALAPASLPGPVDPELARRLAGRWVREGDVLELVERDGELLAEHGRSRVAVRSHGGTLRVDGRLELGATIEPVDADHLRFGGEIYARDVRGRPAPAPERFLGLIGEYGWDHDVLFVFEEDGVLHALIEWIEIDSLTEVAPDVFAFPVEGGLYPGEKLVFRRDERGRASEVEAAGIVFERRMIAGEDVETFTIEPLRPVEELRREALAAEPPLERGERGEFLESDLVELTALDPTLRLDVRYATTNNFMQARCYESARAFLQRPAAEALVRAQRALAEQGYGLLIHDAYRPWHVTKMFWEATPPAQRIFVADPAEGSRHNRGCAVDLTLFDLATGQPVEMVGLYDEMTARSYPDYLGGTALQRWHRELLRSAMETQGFRVYQHEWWHFDFQGWERYRIQDAAFEELAGS